MNWKEFESFSSRSHLRQESPLGVSQRECPGPAGLEAQYFTLIIKIYSIALYITYLHSFITPSQQPFELGQR